MLDEQQLLKMIDIPSKFGDDFHLTVRRGGTPDLHRHLLVYLDSDKPGPDGKFEYYATAIDVMSSEEMVHYRIRAMFAHPPKRVGLYDVSDPIEIRDHPTERAPGTENPET